MATRTRARPERSDGRAGSDPTRAFFDHLPERAAEPLARHLSGSLRFDLLTPAGVEHWYVGMGKSGVAVSQKRSAADAVMRMDKRLFDDIASGRANAMAAVLRGAVTIEGDLGLAMSFQRLFGGPDDGRAAASPVAVARPAGGDGAGAGDGSRQRRHRSSP